MSGQPVTIIGAGLAGTVLGRCLLQRGIHATIYQRKNFDPRHDGYGYTLKKTSVRRLLDFLEIQEDDFVKQTAVDSKGTAKVTTNDDEVYQLNSTKLQEFLRQGLSIKQGHQLRNLRSNSGTISLAFRDDKHLTTNLVIGADGVHSTVRGAIAPETELKVLPYVVFAGKRHISGEEWVELKTHFSDGNIITHSAGTTVFRLSLVKEGLEGDKVSISYVYSRPANEKNDKLNRPDRSKEEARKIPEEFYNELGSYALPDPFASFLRPDLLRDLQQVNWLMRTNLVSRSKLADAAKQGIVLTGEAAHAQPVLASTGANEAILDGMKLAEIVANKHDLDTFYESRYADWQMGIDASVRRMEDLHSGSKSML